MSIKNKYYNIIVLMTFLIFLLILIIFIILYKYYFSTDVKGSTDNDLIKANTLHYNHKGKDSIKYYNKCLKNNNFLVLLNIADIYHFGLNDIDININKATKYYNLVLFIINNIIYNQKTILSKSDLYTLNKYKSYTIDRLDQLNKQIEYNSNDYLLNTIFEDFDKSMLFNNQNIENNNPIPIIINPNPNPNPIINDNININVQEIINHNNIIIPDNIIANDPQSVHDTHINKTIKSSIEKLQKNTILILSYEESKEKFLKNISNNDKCNLMNVLYVIDTSETQSIYNKLTLKELFTLVLNHIYNYDSEIKINAAINNLYLELNDCVEFGKVVCHTGIFNRIIDSLNIIDEDVVIKSRDVLNNEMMTTCALIRNKLEADPNTSDGKDNKLILADEIKKELKKQYVDTNILEQNELDNIINSWIDFV